MAENPGQDRTEEPTGKRLAEARKKGQVPRSRELATVALTLGGALSLMFLGPGMVDGLETLMRSEFRIERAALFDPMAPIRHFRDVMDKAFFLVAPFLAVMVVVAIVAPLALGGWVFSTEALQPKWEKLDPIQGIPRLFALRGLVELVKSLLKFSLIIGVGWALFYVQMDAFLGLNQQPPFPAFARAMELVSAGFLILSAALVVIAAIDVPYQLWDNKRKLKMTLQEVKDEMKETEGRPEIKRRIRSAQMELAQGRMMEKVPEADVVVTNPTHYAVALRYDASTEGAPRVVAKGTDLIAAQIRNLAKGAGVPLVAAPPLARAIYFSTELEREIPAGLYLAVAQVLAYVYQLKAATSSGAAEPKLPTDFPIPDDFLKPSRGPRQP